MKGWLLLISAVTLEVGATSMLNASEGFRRLTPSITAIILYSLCFFIFSRALESIPLGIAYAVWSGLGVVFVLLVGLIVFKQHLSPLSLISIALILGGTILAYISGGIK